MLTLHQMPNENWKCHMTIKYKYCPNTIDTIIRWWKRNDYFELWLILLSIVCHIFVFYLQFSGRAAKRQINIFYDTRHNNNATKICQKVAISNLDVCRALFWISILQIVVRFLDFLTMKSRVVPSLNLDELKTAKVN